MNDRTRPTAPLARAKPRGPGSLAVFCAALLLALYATVATAGEPAQAGGARRAEATAPRELDPSAPDPWEAIAPVHDGELVLRRSSPPRGQAPATTGRRGAAGWARTIGSLAAVVALIMLLAWGYRAVAGGPLSLAGRGRVAGLIDVVSRTAVSPRQTLVLVRIGPRMVLLGVSPERIERLDNIDDAELVSRLAGVAQSGRADSPSGEFREALREQEARYAQTQVLAETDGLERRLSRTLSRIRASARRLGAA